MKYKTGDKVKIRSDLNIRMIHVNGIMAKLAGTTATIMSCKISSYRILEDNETCHWDDSMFNGLADESDLVVGKSLYDIYYPLKDGPKHAYWLNLPQTFVDIIQHCEFEVIPDGAKYYIKPSDLKQHAVTCAAWITAKQSDTTCDYLALSYFDNTSNRRNNTKILAYNPPKEQPMPEPSKYLDRPIQVGDWVERIRHYDSKMAEGSIWKVSKLHDNENLYAGDGRSSWETKYFKLLNPEHPSHPNYSKTTQSTDKPKTKPSKPEPVAQPEPIIQPTKESFMSNLKATTLSTIDQNKEAVIIAGKMDAGRIINKQLLKQLKPHVPVLLRGYLDTPLAPIVIANAIALLGNHTGNTKIQKISELLLLAAADTTVQSFNLNDIIDNALSGIKLPAGILESDDE